MVLPKRRRIVGCNDDDDRLDFDEDLDVDDGHCILGGAQGIVRLYAAV